ncbi:leucyl/phenylalanyl-tRNA--protein transferase [Solicola sp. PLA-1-18]|uniref:leucyl/phenylalanyl-tRNA--protein transferase n=1 Tax=Solicola sp. PLA-1-18 TaxID=3380532 RepID=UPI003B799670
MSPVREVPESRWEFDPRSWPRDDCIALGADLEPGTVLAAYRSGAFPMPIDGVEPMAWWSPMERGVLRLSDLRVSRSLRKSRRRYTVTIDQAFDEVVQACADPSRPGAWIDGQVEDAYGRLHRLGWAHSVETRDDDGALVGGLYGLSLGGLFAGESMFHRATDASKVALVGLVELLDDEHAAKRLVDVQWQTPHLESLGVSTMPRRRYLKALRGLESVPPPALWR